MVLSLSQLFPGMLGLSGLSPTPTTTTDNGVSPAVVDYWPMQTYQSLPETRAPWFNITKSGELLAGGYIAITFIYVANSDIAPLLYSDDGELVWQGPVSPDGTKLVYGNLNRQPHDLDGQAVLTYWAGGMVSNAGHGYGEVRILNSNYDTLYTVCPKLHVTNIYGEVPECPLDIHESFLTARGTLLGTVYNITQWDLTEVGGPEDGWIVDSMFVEVDVKTNEIIFMWSPLQSGVPLNATMYPLAEWGMEPERSWDWFHMNSVSDYMEDGYLVNSRMFWGFFALNSKGEIQWHVNSHNGGDFEIPEGLTFSYAHDTRATDMTETSLDVHFFNNANGQLPIDKPSTGLSLHLDLPTRNVTVKQTYWDRAEPLAAISQGGFDGPFENGNIIMGYGSLPVIKEYGPEGDVRWSARFCIDNAGLSYRAYKVKWTGTPSVDKIAVKVDAEQGKGWVSWNGDTRTTKWIVYAASEEGVALESLGVVDRTGFETEFEIPVSAKSVQIAAFQDDVMIGNSTILAV